METKNFENLKNTLQDSIFTWDYFTDFEKVKINVKKIEKELNLLNYLIGKENIEEEFLSLIEEYPKVRKILPILIAIRDDKLSSTPIITNMETLIPESKKYIFNDEINEKIKKELLIFFKETGLKEFFESKVVKNLVDYCIGVEVGFDTNARKNRTGTLMENIVGKYLETFCTKNKNFSFIEQATQKRIKEAARLGFGKAIVTKASIEKINDASDITLVGAQNLKQAIEIAFPSFFAHTED